MSTNQQRREAAQRKLKRQQERREQRAESRKKTSVITAAVVVVAVVVAVVVVAVVSGSGGSEPSENNAAAPSAPESAPAAAPTAAPGACAFQPTPGEPPARPVSVPTQTNPPNQGTVTATIATNQGTLPITLNRAGAPCTVESFVHLAKSGFYNNTPCHRLVNESSLKVLQCGDPTGSGTGGPGYTIPDEPPTTLAPGQEGASIYPRGTLAMAKASAPNTGGSQFFLVFADSQLPPDYTVFGTVAEPGIKVLEKIANAGDDGAYAESAGGGKPNLATTLQTVTVSGS